MVISKKMKIIGFSMLGVAITTIAIAVPLSLKKSDDKKSLSVREKFVDLTKKEIVINENSNLNLSTLANQTKVINEIKKRVSFLNKKQKDSIKIKTKTGLISYKDVLKIEIIIILDKKEETFSFKFKRITNNQDRFFELSQQDQILENESSNLNLSNLDNQNIVKKHLQKQASFLTDQEKNSIKVITNNKTITDLFIKVEIKATFFKIEQDFFFNFSRKESNAEKSKNKKLFDSLKAKFDQVNLTQTLTNQVDLDLSNLDNQNIVKDFIVGLINATVGISNVTNEEEKGIIIIDSTRKIITHTNSIDVNLKIIFGANTKTYTFKLKRTIAFNETTLGKFSILKAKIDKVNLTQTLNDKIDLDLANNNIQTKVKQFIFDKIDATNTSNQLSQEEKDVFTLLTTSGTITHTNSIDVNLKIIFGANTKTYTFKLKRTKLGDNVIGIISSKLNNVPLNELKHTFNESNIDLTTQISKEKIRQAIFEKIDAFNPTKKLSNEEKNLYRFVRTNYNNINHNKWTVIVVAFINYDTNLQVGLTFSFKGTNS